MALGVCLQAAYLVREVATDDVERRSVSEGPERGSGQRLGRFPATSHRAVDDMHATRPRTQDEPVADGAPSEVLVVDDDESSLTVISRILSNAGHRVHTARNGVEAVRVLLTDGPPLVITDWIMPGMDGLELCRAIRRHEGIRFAYVVMVTGQNPERHGVVAAFEAGADDFLYKPVNQLELLSRIRAGERIIKLQRDLDARGREAYRYNAEMEIANAKLGDANLELHRMATTDELTGLINRREAMDRLSREWGSATRHAYPLSVISLDIDRFKSCNDVYGHDVGDEVLRETAKTLRRSVRSEESLCRFGGEEFLVICPHATEAMAAVGAERLRRMCEAQSIRSGDVTLRATISVGVAERTAAMAGPDDLLRAADAAMYAAKESGRNTVRTATQLISARHSDPGGEEPAATSRVDRVPSVGCGGAATVLLVDHDDGARQIGRRSLERAGFRVRETPDGAAALTEVRREPPEVIVLNADMPGMNGLECLRRLKGDYSTEAIPVVMTAARTDAIDAVAGLEAGADEYLPKPVNPRELVLRVASMVRFARERRQGNAVRGEQSRALSQLLDFTRGIAAAESLDAVLEQTLRTASALAGCRRVSLLLPDRFNRHLRVARALGFERRDVARIQVPIGAAIAGRVFAARERLTIDDSAQLAGDGEAADAILLSEVPSLSIALCAPEGAVGVLNLAGRQEARAYEPVELAYVELVTNIAAAAIDDRIARRARDEARHSIVVAMAKLAEYRDSDTGRHVERVTHFARRIAERLRVRSRFRTVIDDEFLGDLERAVPLHDIGKVAIPDQILLKPGPLTAEEIRIMRQHTLIGAKTIQSVIARVPDTEFLRMAEDIARAHHERVDGRGYPAGLRGDAIPLAARIAAVADVYDAITTERVYKAAMPHERAVAIIVESSGTQFDPDVVEAFLACESEIAELAAELSDELVACRLDNGAGIHSYRPEAAELDFAL